MTTKVNSVSDEIHAALRRIKRAALEEEVSLFGPPGVLWTRDRFLAIRDLFNGRFDVGSGDFLGRLRAQLEGATDQSLQLFAELLYTQQFFTTLTGTVKKVQNVSEVLSWAATHDAVPQWAVEGCAGLASDQSFNQHKAYHLAWLIEFEIAWHSAREDRARLLQGPWAFRDFAMKIESSLGFHQPMREAWLYMMFPESFEPMSSRSDKRDIREAFLDALPHPPSDNIDHDLLEIRRNLEPRFGKGFNYYDPSLLPIWRPGTVNTGPLPQVPREVVLAALERFDRERRDRPEWKDWQSNGVYKFALEFEGRTYPPKEVLSLATARPRSTFGGGEQTNAYLAARDFQIVRLKQGAVASSSDDVEESLSVVAERVLNESRLPMTVAELWSAIESRGLYQTEGADPQRALYAALYRASVQNEGRSPAHKPFVRVAPSTFGLVALGHVSDEQIADAAPRERAASKREIIELLKRDELQDAVAHFEVPTEDRRVRDNLVDALVRSKKVSVAEILSWLSRDRLKDICIDLEIDETGREKQLLIDRILGDAPSDEVDDSRAQSAPVATATDIVAAFSKVVGDQLRIATPGTGWPLTGTLTFEERPFDVSIYVRAIGGSSRGTPTERRFQNPSPSQAIVDDPNRYELLFGLWTEQGIERAVIVAFDAYRRMDRNTRFSMFMPVTLLEQAADTGFATHENNKGETITAFRPENLGRYFLQAVEEGVWQLTKPAEPPTPKKRAELKAAQAAAAPKTDNIYIRPQVGMYAAFARLNYKPWFALAEFLDNAIQSFLHNRDRLVNEGHDGPLIIDVNLDESELTITDRAGGIAWADFPRAFSPATPPEDISGLSEFGLGMKAAACWFARRWTVRTSALGEPVERSVTFDVPKISKEGLENLPIETRSARESDHFTVVTMTDLRVHPRGRTLVKIREHLSSIYRVLMARGIVRLRLTTGGRTEELAYEVPELLEAPYFRTPTEPPVRWRQELKVDLGDRVVTGWAAIMRSGSHVRAGFSVFRRDRLIEGSVGETYKPHLIFGSPNSFSSQRIIGELFVEGFDVSHTKDGIQWGGHEDEVLESIRRQLDSRAIPLLDQAEGYRARKSATSLAAEFGKEAMISAAEALSLPDTAQAVRTTPSVEALEAQAEIPHDPVVLQQRVLKMQIFRDGHPWDVRLELVRDPAMPFYDTASELTDGRDVISVRVNLDHEFSVTFLNDNESAVAPMLRFIAALALGERLARDSGVKSAGAVRYNTNQLLSALSKTPGT